MQKILRLFKCFLLKISKEYMSPNSSQFVFICANKVLHFLQFYPLDYKPRNVATERNIIDKYLILAQSGHKWTCTIVFHSPALSRSIWQLSTTNTMGCKWGLFPNSCCHFQEDMNMPFSSNVLSSDQNIKIMTNGIFIFSWRQVNPKKDITNIKD